MPVDASCWSINIVWSPISKLSRATCQPSVDVPGAYRLFADRHSPLWPEKSFAAILLTSYFQECWEPDICYLGQGTSQHITQIGNRDILECAICKFPSTSLLGALSQQDPSAQYPYEGLDHAKDTRHHSLDLLSLCGASGSMSRAKSSSHLQSVILFA